jgi:hypothetical protein
VVEGAAPAEDASLNPAPDGGQPNKNLREKKKKKKREREIRRASKGGGTHVDPSLTVAPPIPETSQRSRPKRRSNGEKGKDEDKRKRDKAKKHIRRSVPNLDDAQGAAMPSQSAPNPNPNPTLL